MNRTPTPASKGDGLSGLPRSVRFRVLSLVVVGLALSGCRDATGPDTRVAHVVRFDGTQLSALIVEESARVIPSLPQSVARDDLSAWLQRLADALRAGLEAPAQIALADCATAISRFRVLNESDTDSAADLDALQLAVDVARNALLPAPSQVAP